MGATPGGRGLVGPVTARLLTRITWCCIIGCMKRRSAGFLDAEDDLLVVYSTAGPAHRALRRAVPDIEVDSVSSAIRALVIAGHRALEAEQLRQSYGAAVAAGDVDAETAAWYRAVAATLAEIWDEE